jgi:phage terminase large subunit-like protein
VAGRGFGKTRNGAECIRDQVIHHGRRRIALVAPTAADARDVMVEGESGLLAIGPPQQRPQYEPTKRRLTWSNGAIATTYSADEPERLRGPQHDAAWMK